MSIDVLANDNDPDGGALTVTDVTDPALGTAVLHGRRRHVHAGRERQRLDTFDYTVEDPDGATDTATVDVTIDARQRPTGRRERHASAIEDLAVDDRRPGQRQRRRPRCPGGDIRLESAARGRRRSSRTAGSVTCRSPTRSGRTRSSTRCPMEPAAPTRRSSRSSSRPTNDIPTAATAKTATTPYRTGGRHRWPARTSRRANWPSRS